MHEEEDDTVPTSHPYGSITDGEWHCGRCGEDMTGCAFCAGMKRMVFQGRSRGINHYWYE